MRVLDLDMDFFLSDVCPLAPLGERPDPSCAQPWTEAAVCAFLEGNCGLSRENPVPGRVFDTHDGALLFWAEMLKNSALTAPFSVDHIDAHSDLAFGPPGPDFVLQRVLLRPPEKRAAISQYYDMVKLDEANYLLFALAFQWVDRLSYVRNPRSKEDIPKVLLAGGFAGKGGARETVGVCETTGVREADILLACPTAKLLKQYDYGEPVVPFCVFDDPALFRAEGKYDFATMAISPRYAPETADFIADIFRQYIREA